MLLPNPPLAVVAILATIVALTSATTLTYALAAHEHACFYADVTALNKKIGLYFAVQSGGSFDIDYIVTDPNDSIVISGEKERQGDFVFNSEVIGEYTFCFSNGMSTFAEKLVDFDIAVEGEKTDPNAMLPPPSGSKTKTTDTSYMEETLYRISSLLNSYSRNQKFYRTRENRNNATVQSTESRVFWFAVVESCLMVGMSVMQVFVVKTFFRNPRRRI